MAAARRRRACPVGQGCRGRQLPRRGGLYLTRSTPPPTKVLITGAGGQVGRMLLETRPANLEAVACTHADLDIGEGDAVRDCVRSLRPSVILNAAAYTAVDKAESEPNAARRINAAGP